MSFSFCLNKGDVLIVCGMTLLYQSLGLKPESKMARDGERLINDVIKICERIKAPGTFDLKRVANVLIAIDEPPPVAVRRPSATVRTSPEAVMAAPPARTSPPAPRQKPSPALGRHSAASVSETDLLMQQEKLRRMSMPQGHHDMRPQLQRSQSRASFDMGARPQEIPLAQRQHRFSMSHAQMLSRVGSQGQGRPPLNFDYLSLSETVPPQSPSPLQTRMHHQAAAAAGLYSAAQLDQKVSRGVSTSEWEALLGSIDGGQMNVYDAMYGGRGLALDTPPSIASTGISAQGGWSPDSWDLSGFNLGDMAAPNTAQSVLSLSDESLSSGEEMGMSMSDMDPFRTGMMQPEGFVLDGLDGSFGL